MKGVPITSIMRLLFAMELTSAASKFSLASSGIAIEVPSVVALDITTAVIEGVAN